MNKNMVVDQVAFQEWLDWSRKRTNVMRQINEQLVQGLENPGTGLTLDQLQLVAEHKNPFEKLASPALSTESTEKFELFLDLGIITVSADNDPAKCLAKFRAKYQDVEHPSFYFYNDAITDANFGNPSRILKPGEKFSVRVFKQTVSGSTTSEERLAFLEAQKAVYPGAQGATLVWEQKRDQMPKGYWYVSMDKKERLWRDAGGLHRVPCFDHGSDDGWDFILGNFGDDWGAGGLLLCFCDLPAEQAGKSADIF